MSVDLAIHPAATRHQFRAQVCRLIDRLINVLDDIDGDPDLEPAGDDEPSLSAAVPILSWHGSQDDWIQGPDDDREDESEDEGAQCDDEGHDSDREPSFGGVTMATFGHDEASENGTPETHEAAQ